MKIQWLLHDMTPIKTGHLKANIEYWKYDTLYESARILHKMDKSLMFKVIGMSKQANMIFDLVRSQKEFTKENIDELINYKVEEKNDGVVSIELFISPSYFDVQKSMINPTADIKRKLEKIKSVFRTSGGNKYSPQTRQGMIDVFETEFRKYYSKTIHGKILEDDKEVLSVSKSRLYERRKNG